MFSKYIFAMILMPTETNRKKLLEYVDGFKSIVDQFETDGPREKEKRVVLRKSYIDLIDKSVTYIGDNQQHKKWLDKKIPEVIQTLRARPFFRRFPLSRIVEMVEEMELSLVHKKDILFFEKDKVYVIISGNILMKNHDQNLLKPSICAKFCAGDVLNFLQDQSELFNSLETWFYAQVESEVAVFSKQYFQKMWDQDIMTTELMMFSSLVRSWPLFQSLS